MREMFGTDLLASHRAARLSPTLVNEADLILTMDHGLYSVLQKARSAESHQSNKEKVHVLKEYFGLKGDVADPWAYQGGPEEAERYAATAKELRSIIERGLDQIVRALDPRSNRGDRIDQTVQGGDVPVAISSANTATVTVIIELTVSGIRHTCEVPLDIHVEQIIPVLIQKLGLPTRLEDGRAVRAQLFSRMQNRSLDAGATLRDNGVQDGEVLQIHWSDMVAG
jgi:hypothetical protein